jgi:ABC-2 type transport system permease protein
MPDWMQTAARFNPVDWGVKAARYAVLTGGNWGSIGLYLALLVGLVGVTSGFATWTFRAYQRSL